MYNDNMYNIKLNDLIFAHEPGFLENTKNCSFERIKEIKDVNQNDVVIHTDLSLKDIITSDARINIALLIESQEIHQEQYKFIEAFNSLFKIVLTFDKKLLDKGENFKLNLYGTTWLNKIYRNIWEKNKICSLISSNKQTTTGHKLRHTIVNYLKGQQRFDFIDIYGGNYLPLEFSQTKAYNKEHSMQDVSNKKILGIRDYMFSIVIENCKKDYYFTEKIVDCFLTGTIPIYYGCPSICNFFNEKGILVFNTPDECYSIIESLSKEKYMELMPYIKENFEIAQKYTNFNINEGEILKVL
jgi:hypothetical protein